MNALPASQILKCMADGADLEAVGVLAGQPAVIVRVDDDPALETCCALLRNVPCVSVGVVSRGWETSNYVTCPPELDVLLAESEEVFAPWVTCDSVELEAHRIAEAVSRSPVAAVALVQLLRLTADRRMRMVDALIAESFTYSTLQSARLNHASPADRPMSTATDEPTVIVSRAGDNLVLELNRPEVHNALNISMRDELTAAFDLASLDTSIRGVVVTGRGPSFCSGGDLTEFGANRDPSYAHLVRTTRSAIRSLIACAEKTTFRVHGASAGAGIELAALAGWVTADSGSYFFLPEVGMGLIPGAGGTVSIPRRIGRERTAYMAITGNHIDSTTALSWNLIDEIMPAMP
jgi:enoyl-CoA hydratase/carnithine racemase